MWYQNFAVPLKILDTDKAAVLSGIVHSFFLTFSFFPTCQCSMAEAEHPPVRTLHYRRQYLSKQIMILLPKAKCFLPEFCITLENSGYWSNRTFSMVLNIPSFFLPANTLWLRQKIHLSRPLHYLRQYLNKGIRIISFKADILLICYCLISLSMFHGKGQWG
jgi:hypothetical protein